ncbi:sulfatase [Conexibacter woesei]|uniref:Sulfatase n=1 Tax=Conexibacter woesei (strain DSM 14684 / CCUG 47730 / CIP 108061 / JCM 11494 / NBRC 100937 / ID131577) TaxID=469383 RepID=D3F1X0_CONWI|nr:sulfatase [Conexibacter woesei]ADB54151.1 sulfatase [Conexibacter woesei DSM 14684]
MADDGRISRRALLRGGGASAGLAALTGAGVLGAAATAQAQDGDRARERPNVVLIVADRLRADYVGAYDDVFDDRHAKTPNIDELADQALRFKYAVPDGMPAIPMRRGMLTGMRSYPFRDWRATAGMPAIPGFNKIYDFQPMVTELAAAAGITTVYVTDNPTFTGPRFGRIVRTGPLATSAGFESTERDYLLPLGGTVQRRRQEPTSRVLREGIEQLDQLRGRQPFFLTLDAFDPNDAFRLPRQFVEGSGPLHDDVTLPKDRVYQQTFRADGDVKGEVRDRYAAEVESVDGWVGRFLDKLDDAGLADNTVVVFVGDSGIALGEQGVYGHPAGVWHRRAYHVPFLIRDPDGRWAGDTSKWFASTHDIPSTLLSYWGITSPGRMQGEDLTTLFDDFDLPARPYYTTAIDTHIVTGSRTWLLIGRSDQDRWRLYEAEDEDEPDEIRTETVKSPTVLEEMRRYALAAAGGTLPDFGDTAAIRPAQPDSLDKKVADDGTLDEDEAEANELR